MNSIKEIDWTTRNRRGTHPILAFIVAAFLLAGSFAGLAQTRRTKKSESHSQPPLSAAERDLVSKAIGVVCTERSAVNAGHTPPSTSS